MKNYLEDIVNQLFVEALELRKNASSEFEKGKLFGYYESISKLLNQAEAFGITHQIPLKWRDFNLEDLLNTEC